MGACYSRGSARIAPDSGFVPSSDVTKGNLTFLLLGLDGAGKTTVLNDCVGDLTKEAKKTMGFGSCKMEQDGFCVTLFDVAGSEVFRRTWKKYYARVHAVVWVVDASDAARVAEARDALATCLADPLLSTKPVLVLANKQDVAGALSEAAVLEALDLAAAAPSGARAVAVRPCVARVASNGGALDAAISGGLSWLLSTIESDGLEARVARVESDHRSYLDAVAAEEVRRKAEVDAIKAKRAKAIEEAGSAVGIMGICLKCNSAPAVKKSKAFAYRPVCLSCAEALAKAAKKKAPILCKLCTLRPATVKNKASSWKPCCAECFAALEAGATLATAAAAAAAAMGGGSAPAANAAPAAEPMPAAAADPAPAAAAPTTAAAPVAAAAAAPTLDPTLVPLGSSFDETREKLSEAPAVAAAAAATAAAAAPAEGGTA